MNQIIEEQEVGQERMMIVLQIVFVEQQDMY